MFSRPLRLIFLAVLYAAVQGSPTARVTTPDSFEIVRKNETFKLVKVDDVPVKELKDLSSGVYTLSLASSRAFDCGFESGACWSSTWCLFLLDH